MVIVVWTPDGELVGEECRRIFSMRKAVAENKPVIHSDLAKVDANKIQPEEYDELPELTDKWFAEADLHVGDTLIRRGRRRPAIEARKKLVSLGLDEDVIVEASAFSPSRESLSLNPTAHPALTPAECASGALKSLPHPRDTGSRGLGSLFPVIPGTGVVVPEILWSGG